MKSKVFAVLIIGCVCMHSSLAQSCCSTGMGSNYNILPNLNKRLIGIRYTHTDYVSHVQSLLDNLNNTKKYEYVNSMELFGRFNLKKHLQLSVFIPIGFIRSHSDLEDNKNMGLGDMSFLLQYSVLSPMPCDGKAIKNQLRFGIGTKLPSGAFNQKENNLYSTSVQLGTGSIDFLTNAIYTLRYHNFGFNAHTGYKLNTVNPEQFKFGDKINGGLDFFYVVQMKDLNVMPSVGFEYARSLENIHNHQPVYLSYSDLLTASVSLDLYYKHLAISLSGSPVIYNRVAFMGYKQRYSLNGGIFYNF